jgi:hypothetical protein
MRTLLSALAVVVFVASAVAPAFAADLSLRPSVHRRAVVVTTRPWCVIENTGTAVWYCYPTLATCAPHQVPGTGLYCVRDPIPGGHLVDLR